jgi:hypothetical protein
MKRLGLVSSAIALAVCAVATEALATTRYLLFPIQKSDGTEDRSPVTTDVNIADQYSAAGIGFKTDPHATAASPIIPFTVADQIDLAVIGGGSIDLPLIDVGNGSSLTVKSGGFVGGPTYLYDTSSMVVSGGTVGSTAVPGSIIANGHSTVTMTSGVVNGEIDTFDSSSAAITGGLLNAVLAAGGTITVSGGVLSSQNFQPGFAGASAGGTLIISTTQRLAEVTASSDSKIIISAGGLINQLEAHTGSIITVADASIGNVFSEEAGQITVTGGSSGNVSVGDAMFTTNAPILGDLACFNGTATVVNVSGSVSLEDGSVLTMSDPNGFIGSGLSATGGSLVAFGGNGIGGAVSGMGSSQISISGGNAVIGKTVTAGESAVISIGDATVMGRAVAQDHAALNVNGGSIGGDFQLSAFALGTLTGGVVNGSLSASGSSHLQMSGGTVNGLVFFSNSSSAVITGGTFLSSLFASDSAAVNISGTTIGGGLSASGLSVVTISNARIANSITVPGGATVILNGRLLAASTPVRLTPAGDEMADLLTPASAGLPGIFLSGNGTLEIDGHSLSSTLVDAANDGGVYSEFDVTGMFADGSAIPDGLLVYVQNGSPAAFTLVEAAVPEPTACAALVTLVCLLRRRRNR